MRRRKESRHYGRISRAAQSASETIRYFVSTVGRDEQTIRECIKNQENEDMRLEQMNLWR